VFNHNLETVPSLYKKVRPGSDYQWSLNLLKKYKEMAPDVITKSGIMVGVGETREEVLQTLQDMQAHKIDMVTIGQYLQPSRNHLAVDRFVHPDEFAEYQRIGEAMGFRHVASGPMVRSSYHADKQAGI
jgi:lipoic acid synthetase